MKERVHKTITLSKKIFNNYVYRTLLFTFTGFVMNFVYAVYNGWIAFASRSVWFYSLAAYYLFLFVVRFGLFFGAIRIYNYDEKQKRVKQWQYYRRCGYFQTVCGFILLFVLVFVLRFSTEKEYPGFLLYGVAAYTLWKIIVSVIHLLKSRKTKIPVIMALRDVGYIDALIALFTLQVALFKALAKPNIFVDFVNVLVGLLVCASVIIIGYGEITTADKKLKK